MKRHFFKFPDIVLGDQHHNTLEKEPPRRLYAMLMHHPAGTCCTYMHRNIRRSTVAAVMQENV